MIEQRVLQKTLHTKLTELRARNPRYSARAFGKRLGLSAGATSELLRGRRKISLALAVRIAKKLLLDPEERAAIFSRSRELDSAVTPDDSLQLTADQFFVISEWYHFAILSLIRTQDFKSDSGWIARRLGIKKTVAADALQRLLRLGLIQKNEKGGITRTKARFRTPDDVANLSQTIQRSHFHDLELARSALETLSIESRDFSSITMPLDPELLPKAKELIRKLQDQISELLESGDKKEVFRMCVQLFPLTQLKGKEK